MKLTGKLTVMAMRVTQKVIFKHISWNLSTTIASMLHLRRLELSEAEAEAKGSSTSTSSSTSVG